MSGLMLGTSAAIRCRSSCREKSPVYKICARNKYKFDGTNEKQGGGEVAQNFLKPPAKFNKNIKE